MQCPICTGTNLVMSERQGIEIDYCPQSRGVWLDRGELDKIIERSAPAPAAQTAPQPAPQAIPQQPIPQPYSTYGKHHSGHYKKHKRESFLSDLFDF